MAQEILEIPEIRKAHCMWVSEQSGQPIMEIWEKQILAIGRTERVADEVTEILTTARRCAGEGIRNMKQIRRK